jgi:hypothetical protein
MFHSLGDETRRQMLARGLRVSLPFLTRPVETGQRSFFPMSLVFSCPLWVARAIWLMIMAFVISCHPVPISNLYGKSWAKWSL